MKILKKLKSSKKNWKLKSKHLSVYAGSDWTRYGQRSGQHEYESGLMWHEKKLCVNIHENVKKIEIVKKNWKVMSKH